MQTKQTIRQLIEAKQWATAERRLLRIRSHKPTDPRIPRKLLAIRLMRLENEWEKMVGVDTIVGIKESMEDIRRLPPPGKSYLESRLQAFVVNKLDSSDIDVRAVDISRLLPLGEIFPVIYLKAGETTLWYLGLFTGVNKPQRRASSLNFDDIHFLKSGGNGDQAVKKVFGSLLSNFNALGVEPLFPIQANYEEQKATALQSAAERYFSHVLENDAAETEEKIVAARSLASLSEQEGRFVQALKWYQVLHDLGGNLDGEIEQIAIHALQEKRETILEYIDQALHTKQQLTRVRKHLLWLVKRSPEASTVWVRLGDLEAISKHYSRAIEYYQRGISSDIGDLADLNEEDVDNMLESLRKIAAEQHRDVKAPYERYSVQPGQLKIRAQIGMFFCAQQLRDYVRARYILEAALNQVANASEHEPNHLLVIEALKESLESQEIDLLRQEALHAIAEESWKRASESLMQISTSSLCQPQDFLWLAVTYQKLEYPQDQILGLLEKIPSNILLSIPQKTSREFLEWLKEHDLWKEAETYWQYIADSLDTDWYDKFRIERQQCIDDWIARARQGVSVEKYQAALNKVNRVLEIEPDSIETRMLQAQIYQATGNYTKARQILNDLRQIPEIRAAVLTKLIEIEVSVGNTYEAGDLLDEVSEYIDDNELGGAEKSPISALLNQLNEIPFIFLFPLDQTKNSNTKVRSGEKRWGAIFGVKVTAAWGQRNADSIQIDTSVYRRLLMACAQYSTQVSSVNVAWRYLGCKGSLTLALLCRCTSASEDEVSSLAELLWRVVQQILPHQDTYYTYQPIWDEDELLTVLKPVSRVCFEVVRQVRTTLRDDDISYSWIQPTNAMGFTALQQTLRSLTQQPLPSVIDVHCAPRTLTEQEQDRLTELLEHSLGQLPDVIENSSIPETAKPIAQLLNQSHLPLFCIQVYIALPTEDDLFDLPILAGLELFGVGGEVIQAVDPEYQLMINRGIEQLECGYIDEGTKNINWETIRRLFTLEDAVLLMQLPKSSSDGIIGLPRMNIRAKLPPLNLPSGEGVIIGESLVQKNRERTFIRQFDKDRLRHTYVVGKTGVGKTTLLLNLALQDIESGKGVAVIDPHSQLIDRILERLPKHRLHDVILFDVSDTDYPLAYNIMDVSTPEEANAVISDLVATFYKLYDPHRQGIMGPRFENILRHSMLALFEGLPNATLIDVMHFVLDSKFRDSIVENVHDSLVRSYWDITSPQIGKWGERGSGEVVDWFISKFNVLTNDMIVRHIVGQPKSSLNFRQIMDTGKILLVDLGKGKVGPQVSQFIGLLFVSGLFQAALSRSRNALDSLRPFYVFIDEFQNITTERVAQMFSEARKFNLALTVANQHFSQLTEEIREAITGNVATWLSFQVGVRDADYLEAELYPTEKEELIALPSYHMIVKLLMDGKFTPPFPVRTIPDSRVSDLQVASFVREASRRRYGRHKVFVQDSIRKYFK